MTYHQILRRIILSVAVKRMLFLNGGNILKHGGPRSILKHLKTNLIREFLEEHCFSNCRTDGGRSQREKERPRNCFNDWVHAAGCPDHGFGDTGHGTGAIDIGESQETGRLRMGMTQAPPWYSKNPATGERGSGLIVSVGKTTAGELEVELKMIEVTWATAIIAPQAHKTFRGWVDHTIFY